MDLGNLSSYKASTSHFLYPVIPQGIPKNPLLSLSVESTLLSWPPVFPTPCPPLPSNLNEELKVGLASELEIILALRKALEAFQDQIKMAWLFGPLTSEEKKDSLFEDIFLMILGTAPMLDMATPLHEAEEALRIDIVVVPFSPEEFLQAIEQKNPFINETLREKKKHFIIGDEHGLTNFIS